MINRLRRQFILIAMLSVTLVVFLTAVAINLFNYLSMDRTLSDTLQMISENRGRIPQFPPEGRPGGPPEASLPPRRPTPPGILCCTTGGTAAWIWPT